MLPRYLYPVSPPHPPRIDRASSIPKNYASLKFRRVTQELTINVDWKWEKLITRFGEYFRFRGGKHGRSSDKSHKIIIFFSCFAVDSHRNCSDGGKRGKHSFVWYQRGFRLFLLLVICYFRRKPESAAHESYHMVELFSYVSPMLQCNCYLYTLTGFSLSRRALSWAWYFSHYVVMKYLRLFRTKM